jgi:opacity protein-like surface antigen
MKNLSLLAILVLSLGTIPTRAATETAPSSDWSFSVSPYLWVAAVQVDTRLDNMPPTTPPETTRFESKITGGALLQAQAHYRSFGVLVDFVWIRLDTESRSPAPAFSAVNLESNFFHSTVALSYTLGTLAGFHLELLAGARIWSVHEDLAAQAGTLPGFAAGNDETWVSPAIGASLRYALDKKWSLVGQGFVNVFGGDSDGWELMAGVTYQFSAAWTGTLGYRFLHEEFSPSRLNLNTDISGFVLGATYRF